MFSDVAIQFNLVHFKELDDLHDTRRRQNSILPELIKRCGGSSDWSFSPR